MPAQKYAGPMDVPVRDLCTITDDGCWLWNGALANNYPCIRIAGTLYKVHRISYQQWHDDLSDTDVLRHMCDNKTCVNPNHLVPGTQKANIKDYWKHQLSTGGIHKSGNGWRAKITLSGKCHRKFSLNKCVVEQWLQDKRTNQL